VGLHAGLKMTRRGWRNIMNYGIDENKMMK
jgi:hypothetical protein